ncbi:MAG TPA: hypothetical protein VJX66_05095 [Amycolatopsis sp.]|nr:hypothetical protein [Amycolatopsis sp.]
MRYLSKIVGTACILAAVTACGAQNAGLNQPVTGGDSVGPSGSVSTSPGPTTSVPPSVTSSPPSPNPPNPPGKPRLTVPQGSLPVPAAQIDASALPAGYPHEVWTSNGGTILNIRAQEGGCGHAVGNAVEQTAQHVVINLSETKGMTGQMCTMDIRFPVISVALAAPLDARTVVLKYQPLK